MTKKTDTPPANDQSDAMRRALGRNLTRYMEANGMTAADLAAKTKTPLSTVYTWTGGSRMPRAGTLKLIADVLGVRAQDLLVEAPDMFDNPITQAIAEEMHHNKELALLFMAAKDAWPETLQATHDILLTLKKREKDPE